MSSDRAHFYTMPVSKDKNKPVSIPGQAVQSWLGPYNEGIIDQPDGLAYVTGPCGDSMEISLRIRENRITDSRFRVKGCVVSRACASAAAALAKGKELEEAWDIDEKEIAKSLPGLPVDHRHCALLARDTLRQAIGRYIKSSCHASGVTPPNHENKAGRRLNLEPYIRTKPSCPAQGRDTTKS